MSGAAGKWSLVKPYGSLTLLATLLAAGALYGCATFTPTPQRVRPIAITDTALGRLNVEVGPQLSEDHWWKTYRDSQLDRLVAAAYARNPTLAVAAARIRIANAGVDVAQASRMPDVDLEGEVQRDRYTQTGLVPPTIARKLQTPSDLSVRATYALDLWGRNSDVVRRAMSNAQASRAEEAVVRAALANSIVLDYIALDASEHDRQFLVTLARNQDTLQRLAQHGERAGLLAADAVYIPKAALDTTHAALAETDAHISQLKFAICELAGMPPSAARNIRQPGLHDSLALALPSVVPSDLVLRRPDVAVALWNVAAANADVQFSKASFLPRFNLLGLVGVETLTFGNLFESASRIGAIGVGVSLPVFDGGRLRAQLHASEARYDSATAEYNRVLLQALREIAALVKTWQKQDVEITQMQAAIVATQQTVWIAKDRFKAGLTERSQSLQRENALLHTQIALQRLRAARMATFAELARAVGGDFHLDQSSQADPRPRS